MNPDRLAAVLALYRAANRIHDARWRVDDDDELRHLEQQRDVNVYGSARTVALRSPSGWAHDHPCRQRGQQGVTEWQSAQRP